MNKGLKTKDILLIALLTAVYVPIYFIAMAIVTPIGALGHAISPGVTGLLGGIIIYFISRKVCKMWQFTIMTLFVMAVFALMGGGYLPWLISSVTTAIVADLISSRSKNTSVLALAISSGIMHIGQAWGAILPSVLFLEKYRQTWIDRGQSAEDMDKMIQYTSGNWAIISTIIVFVLAFIGIYIGYFILRKHFKED